MARSGRDFRTSPGPRGRSYNRNFDQMGGSYGTGYGYIRGYDVAGGYGYAGQTARFGGAEPSARPRAGGYGRSRGDRFETRPSRPDRGSWRMMRRGYDRGW